MSRSTQAIALGLSLFAGALGHLAPVRAESNEPNSASAPTDHVTLAPADQSYPCIVYVNGSVGVTVYTANAESCANFADSVQAMNPGAVVTWQFCSASNPCHF